MCQCPLSQFLAWHCPHNAFDVLVPKARLKRVFCKKFPWKKWVLVVYWFDLIVRPVPKTLFGLDELVTRWSDFLWPFVESITYLSNPTYLKSASRHIRKAQWRQCVMLSPWCWPGIWPEEMLLAGNSWLTQFNFQVISLFVSKGMLSLSCDLAMGI